MVIPIIGKSSKIHKKAIGFLSANCGEFKKFTIGKCSDMVECVNRRTSYRINDCGNHKTFFSAIRAKVWVVVEFIFGDLYPGVFDFSPFG